MIVLEHENCNTDLIDVERVVPPVTATADLPPIVVPVVKVSPIAGTRVMGRSRGCCVSGAGGREPRARWGRIGLSSRRQPLMRIWASSRVSKRSRLRHASRSLPLNDSPEPFAQGLPGSMKRVVPPTRCSQSRTAVAVNAGPLADRRNVGGPRSTNSWANRARPTSRRRRRATSRRRPSRVVLIHEGEDPHRAPLGGAVEDEGVGPDVGRPLGPPPHQRAGREPAAAPLGVLPGDPPAFLTPAPLDPLGVHPPARLAQPGRDATGAVAAAAGGQRDAARDQRRRIRGRPGHVALGRPRLAGDRAGPPLRHRVRVRAVGCRPAPLGRAQKFPAATSRTIALARA